MPYRHQNGPYIIRAKIFYIWYMSIFILWQNDANVILSTLQNTIQPVLFYDFLIFNNKILLLDHRKKLKNRRKFLRFRNLATSLVINTFYF